MASLNGGGLYQLKCRRGPHFLGVVDHSLNPSLLELASLLEKEDPNRSSQLFHIFPLDHDSTFLISNKLSGLSLTIRGNGLHAHVAHSARSQQCLEIHGKIVGIPTDPAPSAPEAVIAPHVCELDSVVCDWKCSGLVLQSDVRDADPSSLTWIIQKDPATGAFAIVNYKSGLLMSPTALDGKCCSSVVQLPVADVENKPTQLWELKVLESYTKKFEDVPSVCGNIGDIIRLTSFAPPTKNVTEEVLIGQLLIPFPLVNESPLTNMQKSAESPYYTLRRYGYWHLVYFHDHQSQVSLTTNHEVIAVGLVTNNADVIAFTLGFSVTSEAALAFQGLTASFSNTISRELKVPIGNSPTTRAFKAEKLERNYVGGERVAEAIWYREDRYVLLRKDGTEVLEWVTREPADSVVDSYAEKPTEGNLE